jgi:hypothetical protein
MAIGLMAIIEVLPIPFGNLLPALALMLIGLGLLFGDGIAVILGLLMSGVAWVATTGLFAGDLALGQRVDPGLALRLIGTER